MRSGSLVLYFAAAFGALKEADGGSTTENNILSSSSAQHSSVPEQKYDKTHPGTGEELLLHQGHLHPSFAKKAYGFYITNSGAAYFLMKYFEALWRSENSTAQARRLAEEKNIFSYPVEKRPRADELAEVKQALEATREMEEILENAADAALKNHLRHHDNHRDKKDPQIESLRLAVIDAMRILRLLLNLMKKFEHTPTLVKELEEELDELAKTIRKSKELMVDILLEKGAFAKKKVEAAQEKLETLLQLKTHSAFSPKQMRDEVVAQMETLLEEALTQATQADQPQPVRPDYAKAKGLAKTTKQFILELESYILSLRELNEKHRSALDQATKQLDFARAATAGITEVLDILKIIGDEIDV